MEKKNNSGNCNSGNLNSGSYNLGSYNSGDRNSGNWNSGDRNSGYWNSGNRNTGDNNSGDFNSGDWNSGYSNSGSFNTDEPKMRIFNKETDMTVSEFYNKYNLFADIPLNRWIIQEDMSEAEKKSVEGWEQMGGYLKTLEFKEACQVWWNENPREHDRFLELPNFDWAIFTEITGIEPVTEDMIEIDGKKFSKSTIKEALKNHVS